MKRTTIIEIISLLFVILFLYTSISKLMDYTVFKEQIAQSAILAPVARWIAWILPISEILAAVLLFIPRWRLKGLYTALALMLLFTGYIVAILNFSKHVPCSCGGVLEALSWKAHLAFNGGLIALASTGVILGRGLAVRNTTSKQSLSYNQSIS